MNGSRFDAFSRRLAATSPRRGFLRMVAGGVLGGFAGRTLVDAGVVSAKDDIAFLAKAMRASKFTAKNVDAAIQALALAGIAVYDDPSSSKPIVPIEGTTSPLRLLRWQVRNMALELSARNGLLGEKIDSIFPEQQGIPTPSLLLGGYVSSAKTAGGELARALIGKRNWKEAQSITFPTMVFMLFASDLALDTGVAGIGQSNQAALWAVPAAIGDVCASVEDFIAITVAAVIDVLNAAERGDRSLLVLTGVWDFVVALGQDAFQGVAENLNDSEIATIGTISGALAFGGMTVSLVQSWTVRVDRAPAETRFGIDDEVVTGQMVASVDTGGLDDWPPDIIDCAAVVGIELPTFNATDASLAWDVKETPIDLIREPDMPAALDENGKAIFAYKTNNESRTISRGTEHRGLLKVEATVERQDFGILQEKIVGELSRLLPDPVKAVVNGLIGKPIDDLTEGLVAAATGKGLGIVTITYHEHEEEPTPEPPPPCPIGTWSVEDISSFMQKVSGQGSGNASITLEDTTGRMTYLYTEEGSYKLDANQFNVKSGADVEGVGHLTTIIKFEGSISASYTTENGKITYEISSSDTFSITAEVYLEGNLISSTPIPPTLLVEDVWLYSCGDGELLLSRPALSDALVVLKRVKD
jgi:hypothetical protein